jgi:polyhydroxybutyrate depolymerase
MFRLSRTLTLTAALVLTMGASVAGSPAGHAAVPAGRAAPAGGIVDRPVRTTGCGQRPPSPTGAATTQTIVSGGVDRTYDGVPEKGLPPIQSWLADWAARNHCARGPVISSPEDKVTRYAWRHCAAPVEHYKIEGLGHTWPSTTPNPDSATPTVIDATPIIWAFFLRHPLPMHHR